MALRTFGHLVSDTGGDSTKPGKRPGNRDWVLLDISVDLAALGKLGLTPTYPPCSCGMGSPPSAVLCPWPWHLSLSPTPGSTSSTPSASSPTTLTPRSPTTPSLPWAWWAAVSLGDSPVWGSWGEGEGGRPKLCTLLSACTPSSPGTNNARLAAMLRQLAQYHAKDPNNLFMVRLAQVMIPCLLLVVGKGQVRGPALGVGGEWCPGCSTLLPGRAGGGPRCYPTAFSCAFSATPGPDPPGQGHAHPVPLPQRSPAHEPGGCGRAADCPRVLPGCAQQ